jgi:hypothetical protein
MSSYFITGDIFGKISVRRYRDCVVVFETEPTISEEQITEVSKAADYRINDIETWNSLVIVLHEVFLEEISYNFRSIPLFS